MTAWASRFSVLVAVLLAGLGLTAMSMAKAGAKPGASPASACLPKGPAALGLRPSHALTVPIDPRLLARFGVLRRAATSEDALPPVLAADTWLGFRMRAYLPRYVRQLAVGRNDERYFLVPGFPHIPATPPASCMPKALREHRGELLAEYHRVERERRRAERKPSFCVVALLPGGGPNNGELHCEPFAEMSSGSVFYQTLLATSEVVGLVPDGVASVRIAYRTATVIDAPVNGDNSFVFTPPQAPVERVLAEQQRLYGALERPHLTRRERLLIQHRLDGVLSALPRLAPTRVQWMAADGQVIRTFRLGAQASNSGGFF